MISMPTERFTHAFARTVSRSLAECALTHLPRGAFDLDLARGQHTRYVRALEGTGVTVNVLPEAPELPDATFVEDPVVMLDEVAILGRPGIASRVPEAELIARDIVRLRPLVRMNAPGILEGGDVLRLGRTLFVGLSQRTDRAGIDEFRRLTARFDYRVVPVTVSGCLHLKTAATSPIAGVLLANPDWVDLSAFEGFEILRVPPDEPWGANVLSLNGCVLAAASAPRTAGLLAARGLDVRCVDISELQKAEAGLTCLSILYRAGRVRDESESEVVPPAAGGVRG